MLLHCCGRLILSVLGTRTLGITCMCVFFFLIIVFVQTISLVPSSGWEKNENLLSTLHKSDSIFKGGHCGHVGFKNGSVT